MKQLPKFTDSYFKKFSEEPVELKPFDPASLFIAQEYTHNLRSFLSTDFPHIEIHHRGSTALGISGKGDIEVGVYPLETQWENLIAILSQKYSGFGNLEDDYARFNDTFKGYDMEVIVLKGYPAELDKKLGKYLANNRHILAEYESVKNKYSYSKREYQIQKDKFFRKIISVLP